MKKSITVGIILTDGKKFLCGLTPKNELDIPKGNVDKKEKLISALRREVKEETGLDIAKDLKGGTLVKLGKFEFTKNKDLCLYAYVTDTLPNAKKMSSFDYYKKAGLKAPEFISFGYVSFSKVEDLYFKGNLKMPLMDVALDMKVGV